MKRRLIKKLLGALDGSKSADRALDFALDLVKKYSAEITLNSVFDAPSVSLVGPGLGFAPASTTRYLEKIRAFHEKVLLKALKKAMKVNSNLRVSTMLLQGGHLKR